MAKVITAAQQRITLAAKKKPPRQQLKNVLAQPFARHWPECSPAEAQALIDSINSVQLPASAEGDGSGSAAKTIWRSSHCTIGMQATLRRLNKPPSTETRIDLLLLAADIRPKFIVDQVLLLAFVHNPQIRCVLLPELQQLLKPADRLGLPACMCIALTGIATTPELRALGDHVAQLMQRFPVPASYQRNSVQAAKRPTVQVKPSKRRALPPVRIDEIHLPRQQSGQRAFVPEGTVDKSESTTKADWSDYISLGGSNAAPKKSSAAKLQRPGSLSAIEAMRRKMKVPSAGKGNIYRTLTVNRVQGNPNKVHKHKNAKPNKR